MEWQRRSITGLAPLQEAPDCTDTFYQVDFIATMSLTMPQANPSTSLDLADVASRTAALPTSEVSGTVSKATAQ